MSVKPTAGLGLAMAAALLAATACLNFRPAIPAPDFQVGSLILCRGVTWDGSLLAPVDIQEEFRAEDESAACFVRLKGISADTWLRWKWYSPQGKLVRDSGQVPVEAAGSYLETVTAFDRLDFGPDPEARPAGEWTVVFFIEDALAGRRTFRVSWS